MIEFNFWEIVGLPLTILGLILYSIIYKVKKTIISPYTKANLLKRLLASFIDVSICFTFYYLFTYFKNNYFLIIIGAYILCKDILFEGRSIGKLLVGLIVIQITNGKPCKISQSILRNTLFIIPGLNIVSFFFEVFLIYKDKQGIRLGDRLANTQVIEGMKVPELAKYFQFILKYYSDKVEEITPETELNSRKSNRPIY